MRFMLAVSFILVFAALGQYRPAGGEDDPLAAAKKQLEKACDKLFADTKVKIEPVIAPVDLYTLGDAFGFVAKTSDLMGDKGRLDRVKNMGGLIVVFKNTETKDLFIVIEKTANETIDYRRDQMAIPDLYDKLFAAKEEANKILLTVKELKMDIRVGEGVGWFKAAAFIAKLKDMGPQLNKLRTQLKKYTIIVIAEDNMAPDFANKTLYFPFSMTLDKLVPRMDEIKAEETEYGAFVGYQASLLAQGVKLSLTDALLKTPYSNKYRNAKSIAQTLAGIVKRPDIATQMRALPIQLSATEKTQKTDKAVIINIELPAIDTVFK
ncbi:MAG: hypothetical protein WC712_10935 [Candidatus Brocadiia bacterium]